MPRLRDRLEGQAVTDIPIWAQDRAREWLAGIYTNGFGEQATRLVLINDGPPRRDLGGWGREVLRDRLAALLVEVKGEPPDQFGACERCHDRNISVLLCPKCDGRVVGLAEVRRVVEGVLAPLCDEILSRLEKL